MKNILVTSLGTTWTIIPELLGFFNHVDFPFYDNHPEYGKIKKQIQDYSISAVDEIWVITTNGQRIDENLGYLNQWVGKLSFPVPEIKSFSYKQLVELNTIEEIDLMADLVYRVTLHANHQAGRGKVYLSLAGGRKNMSANIQSAGQVFGCDALIHVMAKDDIDKKFAIQNINSFVDTPGEEVACFYPMVLQGRIASAPFLYVEPRIAPDDFPLNETVTQEGNLSLLKEIRSRQQQAANSLFSLHHQLNRNDPQNSFMAFQMLHPAVIERLKEEKIGLDPKTKEEELAWLKKIPKADLHCHFGGILSPGEMIEVALANLDEINKTLAVNPDFREWYLNMEGIVKSGNLEDLPTYDPKNNIRQAWRNKGIAEPIAIAAFLTLFKENASFLEKYIYHHLQTFKGIGINAYEQLGDLQGSSLLQNEKSIRKTCEILKRQCVEQNIKYLEVRCSPINYTRGGLTAEEVVRIMIDEFKDFDKAIIKLIFIASRHGETATINNHVNLALTLLEKDEAFRKMFVGFDLAGAEHVKTPGKLRENFMRLLEKSIPTTIHAGEDMPVTNIWEAVYHLSADRIGHGLTLNDDKNLKKRFIERKIAIELCPSSNDQIIGYHDFHHPVARFENKEYPLKGYLKDGLKVTINTDDPGISLTNITNEYYKATCMNNGGLSKWEILQISRNGFKYGFLKLHEKKELLINVEKELFDLLNNG